MFVQLFRKVEQVHRDLNAADSIGESMVELADHCRTTILQTVNECRLPKRPRPVEILHLGQSGHLEYIVKRAGGADGCSSHVVVQVEVPVVLPPGRGWRR
jgi:hypothetical protein